MLVFLTFVKFVSIISGSHGMIRVAIVYIKHRGRVIPG